MKNVSTDSVQTDLKSGKYDIPLRIKPEKLNSKDTEREDGTDDFEEEERIYKYFTSIQLFP